MIFIFILFLKNDIRVLCYVCKLCHTLLLYYFYCYSFCLVSYNLIVSCSNLYYESCFIFFECVMSEIRLKRPTLVWASAWCQWRFLYMNKPPTLLKNVFVSPLLDTTILIPSFDDVWWLYKPFDSHTDNDSVIRAIQNNEWINISPFIFLFLST